jgi:glycerate-2-kinase
VRDPPPTVLYSDSGMDVDAVASGPIVTGTSTIAQSCAIVSNVAVSVVQFVDRLVLDFCVEWWRRSKGRQGEDKYQWIQ